MSALSCVHMFQTRLAMAKETVNALMRADTERVREFVELKVNIFEGPNKKPLILCTK